MPFRVVTRRAFKTKEQLAIGEAARWKMAREKLGWHEAPPSNVCDNSTREGSRSRRTGFSHDHVTVDVTEIQPTDRRRAIVRHSLRGDIRKVCCCCCCSLFVHRDHEHVFIIKLHVTSEVVVLIFPIKRCQRTFRETVSFNAHILTDLILFPMQTMQDRDKGARPKRRWSFPSNLRIFKNSQSPFDKEGQPLIVSFQGSQRGGNGNGGLGGINDGIVEIEPAEVGDKRGGGVVASRLRLLRRRSSSADVGMVTDGR